MTGTTGGMSPDADDVRPAASSTRPTSRRLRLAGPVVAVLVGLVVAGTGAVLMSGWTGVRAAPASPASPVSASPPLSRMPTAGGRSLSEPTVPTPYAARLWQRLPDPPLSPRHKALGVLVDGQVLVLGGSDATASGGMRRLPELRDGAALDLSTRRWHPVAAAPWPPAETTATAVAGRRVVLAGNGFRAPWLVYDTTTDSWTSIPAPPKGIWQATMAVDGDRVFVLDRYVSESSAPVQVLDLGTHRWSALPRSPSRPTLNDRTLVATDAGLVVMAGEVSPRRAGNRRQPALAEVWDGHRWTRFMSRDAAGMGWYWTGSRVISTYRTTQADSAREGGIGYRAAAFNPDRGTWKRLPWLPVDGASLDGSSAYGPLVLSEGHLYDDRTGRSTPVPRPGPWTDGTTVLTADSVVRFGGLVSTPGQTPRLFELENTNEAWTLPIRSLS